MMDVNDSSLEEDTRPKSVCLVRVGTREPLDTIKCSKCPPLAITHALSLNHHG